MMQSIDRDVFRLSASNSHRCHTKTNLGSTVEFNSIQRVQSLDWVCMRKEVAESLCTWKWHVNDESDSCTTYDTAWLLPVGIH